jgi:hypothetical protein
MAKENQKEILATSLKYPPIKAESKMGIMQKQV